MPNGRWLKLPSDAPQRSDKKHQILELPGHSTNELHPTQVSSYSLQFIQVYRFFFQAGVVPYQLQPPALLLAPFALHPPVQLLNQPSTVINQSAFSTPSTHEDVRLPSQLME